MNDANLIQVLEFGGNCYPERVEDKHIDKQMPPAPMYEYMRNEAVNLLLFDHFVVGKR